MNDIPKLRQAEREACEYDSYQEIDPEMTKSAISELMDRTSNPEKCAMWHALLEGMTPLERQAEEMLCDV